MFDIQVQYRQFKPLYHRSVITSVAICQLLSALDDGAFLASPFQTERLLDLTDFFFFYSILLTKTVVRP